MRVVLLFTLKNCRLYSSPG